MAATAFPAATDAALQTFRAGGNAIDAAAAAAWTMAVCDASGSGLGGQTIVLIRAASGAMIVVDGHSRAPAAVSQKLVRRRHQRRGHRACTVPTTPAALGYIQNTLGRLPAAEVFEPAIRLATEGYAITRLQAQQLRMCLAHLRDSPAMATLFLREGRRPYRAGQTFRQPALAATLRRLSTEGIGDFYRGAIARAIVEDMQRNGGLITDADLASAEAPAVREPCRHEYRGYRVISPGPPAGGLQILFGLNILQQLDAADLTESADRWYEMMAQTTRIIFCERDRWAVHPRDLTPSFLRWFLSDERAREHASALMKPAPPARNGSSEEPGETTHLCTADAEGNVVSLTQSVQSLFGAKAANAELGFLYNNYLYTCPRHQHPYQLESRCLPQSNAAPTLVLDRDGKPRDGNERACRPILVLGAAGSRRIASSILQVISSVLDRGLALSDAVGQPRVHALARGKVFVEDQALTDSLRGRLARRFDSVSTKSYPSWYMGSLQAIGFARDGTMSGAADPRRDGSAGGFESSLEGRER
jgi:gamma-glutamyltranspeptidase/glutathione hydrolase